MTENFHHISLKNHHKTVSMMILHNNIYQASKITPRDVLARILWYENSHFIRIVISAQKTYQNFQPIYHSIKSNTISQIYIEKQIKIASYIHVFILHLKQRTRNKNSKSSSICLQISNLFSLLLPVPFHPQHEKNTLPNINQRAIFVMKTTETGRNYRIVAWPSKLRHRW
jgi:hypothetical protein